MSATTTPTAPTAPTAPTPSPAPAATNPAPSMPFGTAVMPAERALERGTGLTEGDKAGLKAAFKASREPAPVAPPAPAPSAKPDDTAPVAPLTPTKSATTAPPAPTITPEELESPDFQPSRKEHWNTVKSQRDSARKEASELKARLESLGDVEVLKGLAKERDELKGLLRQVAADRDPEFVKQFEDQKAHYLREVQDTLGVDPTKAAEAVAILKAHGGNATPYLREWAQRNELDSWAMQTLMAATRGLRDVEASRERIVRESVTNWEKHVTDQTLQATRAREQVAQEALKAVNHRLEAALTGNGLFAKVEGNEEWNMGVEKAVEEARAFATGELDPDGRSNLAMKAAAYPQLVRAYTQLQEQFKALQSTAGKLSAAQPGGGGSSDLAQSTEGETTEEKQMSVGARLLAGLRKAGINPSR